MEGIYQNLGAEMEFISETRDYNPAEFHDNFGHSLPKIVTVNQGFCGEIIDDTFDRGQVIRIQTVSRQPRVVAKSVQGTVTSLYSIPLTYPEHLCVVSKHGKAGKEQSLIKIIQTHQLPVFVQFPKQRTITIGSTSISTNHIPAMELTQNFDEMYLLGNFIIDGVISHDPVHVPLYLSNIRLSLVTAIKGQPVQKWTSYQQEITNACKHFLYDASFGNPEIAVYRPHDVHDDTLYEKLEPATYTNITALFPRKAESNIYQNTKPDKPKKPTSVVIPKPPMHLPQGDQGPPTLPDRPRPPIYTQLTAQTTSPTYENNIPRATASSFRPSNPKIEFTTEKLDFYVSDFITSYEHELPHVVMVNQGYGSFAKEQVLNIQAVSRQERVIVKPKARDNKNVYSFPLTYSVGAQVISKTGALGKLQSLNEILSKSSLPITVKFHSNKTMTMGSQNIRTGPMGAMELVQVFDETYLLGNFIIDGKMADEVTYIPQYLQPLKLSLVNGIEGRSAAQWCDFTAGLERDSNTQEYDMEYGNPEIAEYNDDFLTSRNHACVDPIRYCTFAQIFQTCEQEISSSERSIPDDDTYDTFVDLTDAVHYPAESSTDTQDSTDKQCSFTDELASKFKAMKQKQDGTTVNTTKPRVLTKPGLTKSASDLPKIGKYARKKEQNTVPPSTAQITSVAAVKVSNTTPTATNVDVQSTNTDDIYENDPFKINIPTTKANKPTTALSRHVSQISPTQHGVKGTTPLTTVTSADDVRKLTINEVGIYLKLLNLDKYVETFKNEMVDGTFLVDMDEELLKDDFDFKRIEAKRLLRFASEGHVPR